MLAGWLFGAYHAWREHSSEEALNALLLPPYGIYMSLEYEWRHKNEVKSIMKGVDGGIPREELCRDDDATYRKSRLTREQYEIWCSCSSEMIEAHIENEAGGGAKARSSSRSLQQVVKQAQQSCYSTARYLGAPMPGVPEGDAAIE